MKEQLISFKTAKLAKEKGFNEPCSMWYEGHTLSPSEKPGYNSEDPTEYAAPTQSLLQKWLREKHNIDIYTYVERSLGGKYYKGHCHNEVNWWSTDVTRSTYEELLEELLKMALATIE